MGLGHVDTGFSAGIAKAVGTGSGDATAASAIRLRAGAQRMNHIKVDLTVEELKLLASLASDQLFRREFIDPKMPGYKADPAEVHLGKALVGRLRHMIGEVYPNTGSSPTSVTISVAGNSSKRTNGGADAV